MGVWASVEQYFFVCGLHTLAFPLQGLPRAHFVSLEPILALLVCTLVCMHTMMCAECAELFESSALFGVWGSF